MDKTQHPLLDVLTRTAGDGPAKRIGQTFGLTVDQTNRALNFLAAALMAGLRKNTSQPGGMDALFTALNRGTHARYLDHPESLMHDDAIRDGSAILSHIIGGAYDIRQVAKLASEHTGLQAETLEQMLPLAAAMVMGGLSKETEAIEHSGEVGGLMNSLFLEFESKEWFNRRSTT